MTKLYYQDLRKHLEKVEAKWAWAVPRIFCWVDSQGVITSERPNNAVALWERDQELHEAEMARLEAELDARDRQRQPMFTMPERITPLTPTLPLPRRTPSPVRERRVGTPALAPSQRRKQAA